MARAQTGCSPQPSYRSCCSTSPRTGPQKPLHPDDVPPHSRTTSRAATGEAAQRAAPSCQLRKPSCKHAHLRAEWQQRACPCCGQQRQEIGADESWQVEYIPGHFERIHHVRKKYACADCEHKGDSPQIEVAAKSEAAIDKGMAGPGLLAYIVTSKFC